VSTLASNQLLPVKHQLLTEEVTHALRQAIIEDTLPGGERIVEATTATRLGVSRVPVREALAELLKEGLVEQVGARGLRVRDFTLQDLHEIAELRQTLEVMAVKILCRGLPAADLTDLREEAIRPATETDPTGVARADVKFHQCLVRVTRHTRLIESWSNLRAQMEYVAVRVQRGVKLATGNLTNQQTADAHRALLRLIQAGDEDRAVPFIEKHIGSNREGYSRYFELERQARGSV
jgi:DNA-binding GntR family transcriptional regulator